MSAKVMYMRYELLKEWRKYICLLKKAVERILPNARIYVFGGAAEERLTALSDIDVLIVYEDTPSTAGERAKIIARIKTLAEELGVPFAYPFEIHLIRPEEFKDYNKYVKKIIEI